MVYDVVGLFSFAFLSGDLGEWVTDSKIRQFIVENNPNLHNFLPIVAVSSCTMTWPPHLPLNHRTVCAEELLFVGEKRVFGWRAVIDVQYTFLYFVHILEYFYTFIGLVLFFQK